MSQNIRVYQPNNEMQMANSTWDFALNMHAANSLVQSALRKSVESVLIGLCQGITTMVVVIVCE
jgi:hypothetical protein